MTATVCRNEILPRNVKIKLIYYSGIVTQGSKIGWVTSYNVQYTSEDPSNGNWISAPAPLLGGNIDSETKVTQFFEPFDARAVKIVPRTWSTSISMRAGVLTSSCCNIKFKKPFSFRIVLLFLVCKMPLYDPE